MMRRIIPILLLLVVSIPILLAGSMMVRRARYFSQLQSRPLAPAWEHGLQRLKISIGGQDRTYCLYIPPSVDLNTPTPLVMVLHGAGGEGEMYLTKNGWEKEAGSGRFMVVAPDGLPARVRAVPNFLTNPRIWRTGQVSRAALRSNVDDTQFLNAIFDRIQSRFKVDSKRVFVCGHSNGSSMTFRYAASPNMRAAAVAMVAGQMTERNPILKQPIPTLYLIGDKDPLNPLAGGMQKTPWSSREVPPVQDQLAEWAKGMGIRTQSVIRSDDRTKTVVEFGPSFQEWIIKGQGHMWPGGEEAGLPPRFVGPSLNTVDATHEIWKFFQAHP